jgi:glycosyltransferase involved in cell wall biosynthesis
MKNNNPKVSVVMPVYNGEKYLAQAIESILNQTYQNFEFIIINDASNDNTENIILGYKNKDPRIVYIKNKKNLQISSSRNKGVEISKTEYIVSMDADDIAENNRIDIQIKELINDDEIGVVGCNINLIDSYGNFIAQRKYPKTDKELKSVMFRYNPFAQPGTIIRKSAILKAGLYNPKLTTAEDLDLWFKIGKYYKFKSVDKPLLNYRLSLNSSSNKNLKDTEILTLKIRYNAYKNLGYKITFYDILYNLFHFISIWIIPSKMKIWLFNFIRNR